MLSRPPRRLALFCHRLDDRTIARLCVTVADELTAMGCEVSLVATAVDDRALTTVPAAIEVVDLHAPIDKTTFAVPALARWLKRACPDVLFSQHNGPNRAARAGPLVACVTPLRASSTHAPTGLPG